MVKKLLNLKIRYCIFTLFFLGAISNYAEPAATTNYSFSLLNNKAVVAVDNNISYTFLENITLSDNLSFVNYLWADTPTAKAGFKKVFQKFEVVLLKGEGLEVALAPLITCPANVIQNVDAGNCSAVVNNIDLTTDGTENLQTWELTGATSGSSLLNGINDASGITFNVGVTTVTYYVENSVSESATCSFDVTVIDNENPTLTAGTNQTANTATGLCTASVAVTDATFGDNCTGSSIAYTLSGDTVKASTTGQVGTYTFNKGVTTINYTVTDAAGNTTTGSKTVTVTDNINPTLTAGTNQTANTATGLCTASVAVTDATFSDNWIVVQDR